MCVCAWKWAIEDRTKEKSYCESTKETAVYNQNANGDNLTNLFNSRKSNFQNQIAIEQV